MTMRQNIAVPSPAPKYPAPYPYSGLISPYECAIVSYSVCYFGTMVRDITIDFRRVGYRIKGTYEARYFERNISAFIQRLRGGDSHLAGWRFVTDPREFGLPPTGTLLT